MSDVTADIASSPQPTPLKLSRLLHAAPDVVFRAWTSAEHVKVWFCPDGCTIPEATVEPRVGGAFVYNMRTPTGLDHWVRGSIRDYDRPHRLVIDMAVCNGEGPTLFRALTELQFTMEPGGTRLDVTQTYTLVDPAAMRMVAGAPEGWRTTLEKLSRYVVTMVQGEPGTRSAVHATFQVTRRYDAPVSRVWRALTDMDAKQKWFGGPPGKWEPLERHMDVRVGGTERARGRWDGGTISSFDATYLDVIPHERLVYSYTMQLDERKISVSLATMELRPDGAGTSLTLTEQGAFLDGYDDAGAREHGSGFLLDALGGSLAE